MRSGTAFHDKAPYRRGSIIMRDVYIRHVLGPHKKLTLWVMERHGIVLVAQDLWDHHICEFYAQQPKYLRGGGGRTESL